MRSLIIAFVRQVVSMFFGKHTEGPKKIEAKSAATLVPKHTKAVRSRPLHVPREIPIKSRSTISRRRHKKQQRNVARDIAPLRQDTPVIMEVKEFYPLIAVEVFLPEDCGERQMLCVKAILHWMWKNRAIEGEYFPFSVMQSQILEHFDENSFDTSIRLLDRLGLIKWQTKGGTKFFSLRIKSKRVDTPAETRAFRSAVKKSFFDMNNAVKRRR